MKRSYCRAKLMRTAHTLLLLCSLMLTARLCHGFESPSRNKPSHLHYDPSNFQLNKKTGDSSERQSSPRTAIAFESPDNDAGGSTDEGNESKNKNSVQVFQQTWNNVKFGSSFVNDNYLSFLGYTLSRALLSVSTVWIVLFLAFRISASAGLVTLRFMLQSLQILSYSQVVYFLPLIIPFVVLVGLIVLIRMVTGGSSATVGMASLLEKSWKEATPQDFSLSEPLSILSENIASMLALYLAMPVMEEFQYRYYFDWMKRLMAKMTNKLGKSSDTKTPRINVPTKIVSFVFATAHISNWIPPLLPVSCLLSANDNDTKLCVGIMMLSLAIIQSTGAFIISERILFPMYEQRGLAASISAHATWNLLFTTNVLHIPIRLFNKHRKRKAQSQKEAVM